MVVTDINMELPWDMRGESRKAIKKLAKKIQKDAFDGDFFIRDHVDSHRQGLGLHVFSQGRLHNHLILQTSKGKLRVKGATRSFKILEDLLQYYGDKHRPELPTRLEYTPPTLEEALPYDGSGGGGGRSNNNGSIGSLRSDESMDEAEGVGFGNDLGGGSGGGGGGGPRRVSFEPNAWADEEDGGFGVSGGGGGGGGGGGRRFSDMYRGAGRFEHPEDDYAGPLRESRRPTAIEVGMGSLAVRPRSSRPSLGLEEVAEPAAPATGFGSGFLGGGNTSSDVFIEHAGLDVVAGAAAHPPTARPPLSKREEKAKRKLERRESKQREKEERKAAKQGRRASSRGSAAGGLGGSSSDSTDLVPNPNRSGDDVVSKQMQMMMDMHKRIMALEAERDELREKASAFSGSAASQQLRELAEREAAAQRERDEAEREAEAAAVAEAAAAAAAAASASASRSSAAPSGTTTTPVRNTPRSASARKRLQDEQNELDRIQAQIKNFERMREETEMRLEANKAALTREVSESERQAAARKQEMRRERDARERRELEKRESELKQIREKAAQARKAYRSTTTVVDEAAILEAEAKRDRERQQQIEHDKLIAMGGLSRRSGEGGVENSNGVDGEGANNNSNGSSSNATVGVAKKQAVDPGRPVVPVRSPVSMAQGGREKRSSSSSKPKFAADPSACTFLGNCKCPKCA